MIPDDALRHGDASQFKAIFQWMIENAVRTAQQDVTLQQYFRWLTMTYKNTTGVMLDEHVVSDVNAVRFAAKILCFLKLLNTPQYIKYFAKGKKKTSPRSNPVPSGADSVGMLHFLYSEDTTRYPDERQRVKQAFLMIIHAYSGLWPSSTTQSGNRRRPAEETEETAQETEEVVKLRYGDVALMLTEDELGDTRFAVQPTFT